MLLIVIWEDGREEEHACSPGDTVDVGEGEVQGTVPLYHPDGPTLLTVRLRGGEIPALVLRADVA